MLGVIVAAHAVVLLILSLALDRSARAPVAVSPVGTLLLLLAPAPATAPSGRGRLKPIEPLALPPIVPPDIELPGEVHAPIDWLAEADRAAEGAISAPHPRSFGEMPQAPSWLGSSRTAPAHYAGEQYRLETGEWVTWVSDRCYIVSEPQPLGMPDVFARSLGTRMGCQSPPGLPPGELFRDLAAYQKHHPQ